MTTIEIIHICVQPVYEYQGWYFEVHGYLGPWPLRRDNDEPFKRVGEHSKFWDVWDSFNALTPAEQKQYCVSGSGRAAV